METLILNNSPFFIYIYFFKYLFLAGKSTYTTAHTAKEKIEFFNHMFTIFKTTDTNGFILPGNYSFPFSFVIPEYLPGTFRGNWKAHHGKRHKAKITYKIKAGMKNPETKKALFKKLNVFVDQKFNESLNQKRSLKPVMFEQDVKAYGCCRHGKFRLGAIFNEKSYISGDTGNVSFSIDASEAKSDIKALKVELLMRTKLNAKGRKANLKKILTSVNLGSLKKGETRINENSYNVNLLIKSGGEAQATCIGKLIQNEFEVRVVADIDGCSCCINRPKCKDTVQVVNAHTQPPSLPTTSPAFQNWKPNVFPAFACQMTQQNLIPPAHLAMMKD